MSAITTAAAGDWSATGTWTGGVVPGNGDTVTLNHAVSVSDARTVGTSPAAGSGTNAIRCNAVLTVASGGVLTVRGDIGLNNVGLTVAAGGIMEFDASAAGTPSTALYVCKGINATDPNAIITVTGSSGSHATIRSNAGGANGRFTHNGNDHSGFFNATFCDFLRVGDASNAAMTFIMGDGEVFSLTDCTFDACGSIGDEFGVTNNAGAQITLLRVRTVNGVGNSLGLPFSDRTGSGIRSVTFCDFDQNCLFYSAGGYTITDTVFRGGYDATGGNPDTFQRNVLAFPEANAGDWFVLGTVRDCYAVRLGAPSNPHYLTTNNDTVRITGCIFDCPDGDGNQASGDCITFDAPTSAKTITVDHNIALHVNNQNVGTMLSCLGGANLTVVAEHNTYHGGQGIYLGETYAGHANMVSSLKSNLSFQKTGATGYIVLTDVGVATDVVAPGNAIKNGVWHPNGTGYSTNMSFSSGSPGAGDVSGDPGFVDVDRNIKTWDSSLGGPGTIANALDEIGLGNRTVQALLDYIRAGFQPTNDAFQAAHDSVSPSLGWMGAVAGPAATSEQEGSRARNDDGSETTATWKAAQDTDITLASGDAARLRLLLNTTGNVDSKRIGLGYKVNGGQLREVH
jgi:hypothetical protein